MAFKKLFALGLVAAVLAACGDDASSGSVTGSNEDSSSSVGEGCDDSSSSFCVTPQSSDSETSVSSSSSSAKFSSSFAKSSSSSAVSSSSAPEGYVDPSTVIKGTMTDERDGQTYKTVTIGTQTWMAENLNYAYTEVPYYYAGYKSDSASWYYLNNSAYYIKFGRLYTWSAAMDSVGLWTTNGKGCGLGNLCSPTYPVRGICPEGWHLPDTTEWNTLFAAVGGPDTAGMMLKSIREWTNEVDFGRKIRDGNGTDAYSFTALPTGHGCCEGKFNRISQITYFWGSTEESRNVAYQEVLYYNNDIVDRARLEKSNGFSVRCVKD